jgi:hypothetical protein
MKVGDRDQLAGACRHPAVTHRNLTLGAMAVPAGNGEISITCLMGSIFLWGVEWQKGMLHAASHPFDSPLRLAF